MTKIKTDDWLAELKKWDKIADEKSQAGMTGEEIGELLGLGETRRYRFLRDAINNGTVKVHTAIRKNIIGTNKRVPLYILGKHHNTREMEVK